LAIGAGPGGPRVGHVVGAGGRQRILCARSGSRGSFASSAFASGRPRSSGCWHERAWAPLLGEANAKELSADGRVSAIRYVGA
jgi:hypothetical protein